MFFLQTVFTHSMQGTVVCEKYIFANIVFKVNFYEKDPSFSFQIQYVTKEMRCTTKPHFLQLSSLSVLLNELSAVISQFECTNCFFVCFKLL